MLSETSNTRTVKRESIEIYTESMEPMIRKGDFISARPLKTSELIQFGQIHWVRHVDYCGLYRVCRGLRDSELIFKPDNERFDELTANKTDIVSLSLVELRVSKLV